MGILTLWAGASTLYKLPSPVSVRPSMEQVWSEDTGRAQSGIEKAKMIGSVVAEKMTYDIRWGILTQTEFNNIVANLPRGFFNFALGEGNTTPGSSKRCYRSEITYDIMQAGDGNMYYKDASVSVIEQ